MFLKKITKIKSIGRFRSAGVRGGEYGRLALFYGGNGRGKTTICAMLRSLQSGDPALVNERKTLGAAALPEADLLFDVGQVRFTSGTWSAHHDNIHIFDGQIIVENVHGGYHVDADHRRNFYRIVVGKTGVDLTKELDEIDAKASEAQTDLKAEERALLQHVPKVMPMKQFIGLEPGANVDQKIADANNRLKAATNAAAIQDRPIPGVPQIPRIPENYVTTLAKTIDDVSTNAAERTRAQIEKHDLQGEGEEWLSYGYSHIEEGSCAFCGQDVTDNELVKAYSGFFSKAYVELIAQISELRDSVETELSEVRGARTNEAFRILVREVEYWRDYSTLDFSLPAEIEQLERRLEIVRNVLLLRVDAKARLPLAEPEKPDGYQGALADWDIITAMVRTVGEKWKKDIVPKIENLKTDTSGADKATIEAEIAQLKAIKLRHSEAVAEVVTRYLEIAESKKNLEADRKEKKKSLDDHDEQIFRDWEAAINRYLTAFGAGFRFVDAKKNYKGKTPQCGYGIAFGEDTIDIGVKEIPGEPSFRTAMSAGDKNTFALAFFLAQLELDVALADKVVIFDDPFTSLDEFRREFTAKCVVRLLNGAAQVIVFSHDKYFLNTCFGHAVSVNTSSSQLSLSNNNISIEEWNIEREVKEGYLQDHMALIEFEQGVAGNAREMRTLMRPLLEKYIRYRFPNQIPDDMWLGDMIGIVRADTNHPLGSILTELEDINDFTAPFHHDPNTAFNEDEVMTHVQRTLAIAGGC